MFRFLPRSGTYRSKTYRMEKAFEFLKTNKAVAFATVEGGKPKQQKCPGKWNASHLPGH